MLIDATSPDGRVSARAEQIALVLCLLALLLSGAIAGFFYSYSVSVMRGLDSIDPRSAIPAMQGINATVRNMAFAPSFFGTPIICFAAGFALWRIGRERACLVMLLAAVIYVCGAFLPTVLVNVPMNEALAMVAVPATREAAEPVWQAYSRDWTLWNTVRTGFSGLALLLVGAALVLFRGRRPA